MFADTEDCTTPLCYQCTVEICEATQSPEMLMLNPLVKGLVDALEEIACKGGDRPLFLGVTIARQALAPFKEVEK